MLFKDLFPLIEKEPFVIIQDIFMKELDTAVGIQTRNCISGNIDLSKQMDEEVLKITMYILNEHPVMKIYLSNSN